MIVWGGVDAVGAPLTDGGRYEPTADLWQPLPTPAAPPGGRTTAIWSGTEMIVWDGGIDPADDILPVTTLSRYEPATDRWTASRSGWEPQLETPVTFWTGTAVLAIGICQSVPNRAVCAYVYDPSADRWSPSAKLDVRVAQMGPAVWASGKLIVLLDNRLYAFTPAL